MCSTYRLLSPQAVVMSLTTEEANRVIPPTFKPETTKKSSSRSTGRGFVGSVSMPVKTNPTPFGSGKTMKARKGLNVRYATCTVAAGFPGSQMLVLSRTVLYL